MTLNSHLRRKNYTTIFSQLLKKKIELPQVEFQSLTFKRKEHHEDIELWIRLAYFGNLLSILRETPIAEYKVHGNNLSKVGNWHSRFQLWKTVYLNFFKRNISFSDRKNIIKQLIKVVFKGIKQRFFI